MTEFDGVLANVQSDDDDSEGDTDEELQEAFAAGLLKPGMNYVGEAPQKKQQTNNISALKQKLAEFEKKLPWLERLDMHNAPAALAPELAFKESEHSKERSKDLKQSKSTVSIDQDVIHNDFKREMLFYRQAQAAVLEALPRLHSMNIATKRPNDYFAQMAKTDDHMQKIRQKLMTKQVGNERAEKVKKLRELKKYGKKVQIEVQQKRLKEKKDLMEDVKKFKKGQTDNLDFLENEKTRRKGDAKSAGKRKARDSKYGYGGKKDKRNSKESSMDVADFTPGRKLKDGKMSSGAGKPGGRNAKKGGSKRPGKSTKQKINNKKKGSR